MNDESSEPDCELSTKQEVELDLLQRRFNNKTQRTVRAIQFNLVAVTAVVGIIQIADLMEFKIDGLFLVGGALLLVSGGCSFVGLTLNGTQFSFEKVNTPEFDVDALVEEYRSRNRVLAKLMPTALVSGGLGVIVLILAVIEITSIERSGLPLTVVVGLVAGVLLGAVWIGVHLAES